MAQAKGKSLAFGLGDLSLTPSSMLWHFPDIVNKDF